LLANDTHLPALVPSIFYHTHVTFPGGDIAGMTIPGEPFAVLGHNRRVAWGVTTLMADQVDLVRLPLDPDDPSRYRTTTGFAHFERREEVIAVRGGTAERLTVRWSPWGPVVGEEQGAAIARDWVAYHRSRALVAVHAFQRAASVAEFLAAAADLTTPGMNLVAADRDGNIAYYPGGAIPIRASGDGRMPVNAGVSPAGWPAFVPAGDAPVLYNPRRGYIVTANNQVGRSPRARRISSSYAEPFRADRITARIEQQERHDVASLAAIQLDAISQPAVRMIQALPEGPLAEPAADRWWRRLRRWDGGYRRGPEPAVFEAFSRRLRELVFADDAGSLWTWGSLGLLKASRAYVFREVPSALADRDWFDDVGTSAHESREEMVERALTAALADLARSFGPSEADWSWERVHTLAARHPLGGIPVVGWLFRLPPMALPGSADTINANSGGVRDGFQARWIPAFRMVVDLDDPSRSRIVNSTGQSGNPFSRHYRDQYRAWAAGASYPMLYGEEDVRRATAHTLTLTPGSR
jgi:penicillin amidase